MKKPLLWLVGLADLSAMFIGIANAEVFVFDLFSNGAPLVDNAYTQVLKDYTPEWWYTTNDLIRGEFRDGDLHIIAPITEDEAYDNNTVYYLFFSPYRIEQIKSWNPSVDISRINMRQVEISADAENIEFLLWSAELDPEQAYYGFVSPVDIYENFWSPSNEICFKLSTSTYNQWEGCDAFELVLDPNNTTSDEPVAWTEENQESHGAACVGMNMANITHVVNWDTITLKWTAVDGDVVQIAVFDPDEAYWKSLGAVNMTDEKFTYKMQWNGEQNFMLTNGCGEVRYKADAAIKEPEPEKIVPTRVGPAENILYVAIAAIILYGAYVLFFRKSEN